MTQSIDPIKLKAAAEHLEWVLEHYPASEDVQGLYRALSPLIEAAKACEITNIMGRMEIPGAWNFSDGRYVPYQNPSVDSAYADFATEMRGGRTDEEWKVIADLEAKRKKFERPQS